MHHPFGFASGTGGKHQLSNIISCDGDIIQGIQDLWILIQSMVKQ